MGLISEGIEKVMVFELPGGIWAGGGYVESPRFALVKWLSGISDKFYQVYVNGRYAGTTLDSRQRQMVVHIPSLLDAAVRIEVFAVELKYADIDFCSEFDWLVCNSGRVKITMLRRQNLPICSTAQVYFDNGTGQIDYDEPLNDKPIRIWSVWQDMAGFGMSSFGRSDFGYDSSAAVGFGKGSFGHGEFGIDADTLEWISPPLDAGVYKFAVRVIDQAGNQTTAVETEPITVTPLAEPAEKLSISSFDKQTNQLVLSIS